MSTAVREALAEAASTVEGINAHPYFVQSLDVGAAMVRLDRIEYPNPFGGIAHWDVVVILPQDMAAAEKYIDDNRAALITALESELVITQIRPQRLDLPSVGVVPTLFITGHRED